MTKSFIFNRVNEKCLPTLFGEPQKRSEKDELMLNLSQNKRRTFTRIKNG